jgi:hypothetical protein
LWWWFIFWKFRHFLIISGKCYCLYCEIGLDFSSCILKMQCSDVTKLNRVDHFELGRKLHLIIYWSENSHAISEFFHKLSSIICFC